MGIDFLISMNYELPLFEFSFEHLVISFSSATVIYLMLYSKLYIPKRFYFEDI